MYTDSGMVGASGLTLVGVMPCSQKRDRPPMTDVPGAGRGKGGGGGAEGSRVDACAWAWAWEEGLVSSPGVRARL